MTTRNTQNRLAAIFILVIASLVFYLSAHLPIRQTEAVLVDAAFLPKMVCVIMALCSVLIFLDKNGKQDFFGGLTIVVRAAIILGILFAYAFFMDIIGFEIASVLFLLSTMFFLGANKRRKTAVVMALAATFVLYMIFVKVMYIPLPCKF